MTTNLRISLTILSLGFVIEGAGEAYSLVSSGAFLPGTSFVFLASTLVTLLGLLFLFLGRHEWNEIHRARAARTNLIFGLSLLGGFIAAAEVGVLVYAPSIGTPLWSEALFGAALGSLVFGTFATYAYLVFHLVRAPSRAVLIASAVWALIVSAYIGRVLAGDLPSVLAAIGARSLSVDHLLSPVDYLASYLFVSYFLLFAAYLDAHAIVARGLPTATTVRIPSAPR
ncbi:MAG TPA: hypothetical protein VMG14_02665 [Thermoplasmata archaeon]|jgi:hypothetical protein|nr:hypothetical protein [Thermoplasmata archaeon]